MKYNVIVKFNTADQKVLVPDCTLDQALRHAIELTELFVEDENCPDDRYMVVPDSIYKRKSSHDIGPVIPVLMSAADLDEPTWFDYVKSMAKQWWDARRFRSYQRAGYHCQECGVDCGTDGGLLDAHHANKERRYMKGERDADLEALCRSCHMKRHPGWVTP